MKKIIGLLCVITSMSIFSQTIKFGKVSEAELKEEFYPLDSTANAAYLYRYRNTSYEYNDVQGFVLVTKYHERIKIYNKEGLIYANKLIPYYKPEVGDVEKVSNIKGYTFNIENEILKKEKLSGQQVFDEKKSKSYSYKKIAMPRVKEGSVIDLKYEIRSPYHTFIDDVAFQFEIPVKNYITKIHVPTYYVFKKNIKGYHSITPEVSWSNKSLNSTNKVRGRENAGVYSTIQVKFSQSKVDYKIKEELYSSINIPALKDSEPYIGNIKNYMGGVSYELSSIEYPNSIPNYYNSTWQDVAKNIYKASSFGGELSKVNYFKKDLESIIIDSATEQERLKRIFTFVKNKVKWNGYYGKYTDKGVKKAYKEGVGNVADINLMLTAMLREAGLTADPVLVSSKNNGIPLYPSTKGFNYVVSLVRFKDGTSALLDGTEPLSSPNVLPKRVLNWKGRKIMKDGNSSWVDLANFLSVKDVKLYVKITKNEVLEGLEKSSYTGNKALGYRLQNNKLQKEQVAESIEEDYGFEVEELNVLNNENIWKPLVRRIKFVKDDGVEKINNKLYINPLLHLTIKENPFKSIERKFPVDFLYPWQHKNTISIQLPEGYKVSFIPTNLAIGLPDELGFFKLKITTSLGGINVQSVMQLNESLIHPKYYPELKEFYKQIVAKNLEKIILERE